MGKGKCRRDRIKDKIRDLKEFTFSVFPTVVLVYI